MNGCLRNCMRGRLGVFQVAPNACMAGLLGLRVMSKDSLMTVTWFREDALWTFQSCIQPSLLRTHCILTGSVMGAFSVWKLSESNVEAKGGKRHSELSSRLTQCSRRMRKSFFSFWKEEKPQVYLIFSKQLIFIAFLISSLALPWPFSLASHAWCLITYH